MNVIKNAQAGTFESSDVLVMIEPIEGGAGRNIELTSAVDLHYRESILNVINNTLDVFEIADINLIAKDKGALDATIAARVETAIRRALGIEEGTM